MSKTEIGAATLYLGDCLDVLATLPAESVDAIVTDPPAGIAFMGKHWDQDKGGRDAWIAWMQDVAAECLRVLKPGGHALVWAIPRTSHWTGQAWEQAGWQPRDKIYHAFGSGFPKSLDISKALDKMAGAEREVIGPNRFANVNGESNLNCYGAASRPSETAPATEAARQWNGWGTALKPAVEEWWLFRKPLIGTVAQNILAHGVGGLNVGGCRVKTEGEQPSGSGRRAGSGNTYGLKHWFAPQGGNGGNVTPEAGRFPANLIHDGSEEVVGVFPETGSPRPERTAQRGGTAWHGRDGFGSPDMIGTWPKDTGGSAARFFYTAKASMADRDEGLEGFDARIAGCMNMRNDAHAQRTGNTFAPKRNHHPTVKPTDLMRYLARLITPPGGTVLDPFMGSGSTGKGALLEGFRFVGIEREAEYLEIAAARIRKAQEQPDLFHDFF
ncbi:MAG: DNA-methyltransferase [Saprospiraceae bacterium]